MFFNIENKKTFKNADIKYTISARNLKPFYTIQSHINKYFPYCDIKNIYEMFGATHTFSPLYGGRVYNKNEVLQPHHLKEMQKKNIMLSLTLSNHYFSDDAYKQTKCLLKEHHIKGNSITCTNDDLAIRIKNDYPLYKIKASIIKNINTNEKLVNVFKTGLYDQVILSMGNNFDLSFLKNIKNKEKIILFGNGACWAFCKKRECQICVSQRNFGKKVTTNCTDKKTPLDYYSFFNLDTYYKLGFKTIKVTIDQFILNAKKRKNITTNLPKGSNKEPHIFASFPRCGRTWSHFILCNYINLIYNLKIPKITFNNKQTIIPNENPDDFHLYNLEKHKNIPLIFFTHSSNIGFNKNIVFLTRDIEDMVLSFYYLRKNMLGKYKGTLENDLIDPGYTLNNVKKYYNDWLPILLENKCLIITYNDLQTDIFETFKKVLKIFHLPFDKIILQKAIELSSINKLKKLEKEEPDEKHKTVAPDDPNGLHIRKGVIGEAKRVFSPELYNYVHKNTVDIRQQLKLLIKRSNDVF